MSGPLSSRATKPSIALTTQVAILLGARPAGLRLSLLRVVCATRFGNQVGAGSGRTLDVSLEQSLRTLVRQGRVTEDPAEPGRWRMLAPGEKPARLRPRPSPEQRPADRVLELLPATSGEVQVAMGWTPPGARRHLARMRTAGLVVRVGAGVKGDPYRYERAGAAA